MKRREPTDDDPFVVLGLSAGAGIDDIVEARRRLAKSVHPDVGGSLIDMQRVNAAAQAALAHLGGAGAGLVDQGPRTGTSRRSRTDEVRRRGTTRHDHPSFTVEALPVATFEALLIVASWLGDVILDEPPYGLELALVDPIRGWCRLDLVPDAGASTVSLSVAAEPGYPVPDVDAVRDLWIDGLNRLDWKRLEDGSAGHPVSGPPP